MKYIGAISDTDILINLAKGNRLDILEYLFEQIIIPQYVYDIEIKKRQESIIQILRKPLIKRKVYLRYWIEKMIKH